MVRGASRAKKPCNRNGARLQLRAVRPIDWGVASLGLSHVRSRLRPGLLARVSAGVGAAVLACGGFLTVRAVQAVDDAYRWTAENEAAVVARGFTQSLSRRDLRDLSRLRARAARLTGVHPDLTSARVSPAARGSVVRPRFRQRPGEARLRVPVQDARGRAVAVLDLRFATDQRDTAFARGRLEIGLAAGGAVVLLLLAAGGLVKLLAVAPAGRLSEAALLLAAGRPGPALGWRRRDELGTLAGSLDAIAGTMASFQERLDAAVLHDPLTGLLNHRGLHDALQAALAAAAKGRDKLAVVVLDIDHFEALNAAGGHEAGDEALRTAARVLRQELEPGDVCGRTGGDEFLLALPRADAWRAERVVERLRRAVAGAPVARGTRRISFSAGIAEFPRDAETQAGHTRLAGGALYRAKRSGRNRCVVYSSFVDAPLSPLEEAERARTAGLANTIHALARAVDLKDGYTHQHSARVAHYAAVLARSLGMTDQEVEQIRTAGVLHDVGKVGVADAVLLKPARLTDEEFLEMQRHSALGRDIIAGAGMPEIAEWVLCLHERWDGRGYPQRLAGEEIPFASRVLGVADAFEAMTSSRLYRRGMPVEKALAELERCAGDMFDPVVVEAMVALVRSGGIPVGEIGVLDATHYGSAAGSGSAAPPEEEGEPVRNVLEEELPGLPADSDSMARASSAS
jgi:diguanylate cyclase (GGDEF)-like protein